MTALDSSLHSGLKTLRLRAVAEPNAPAGGWPVVAGYEILDELGRGGMGVVYKARQLGLNRVVALKMILGGPFAEPQNRERFRAEAEAIARLQHPNIVQVFAAGSDESTLGVAFACPFFTQEYVGGGSLDRWLGGAPQPPRDAARFVETLARAVQYAHSQGIVHRDLKPANVLLSRAENPELGGTGITRASLLDPRSCSPKIADFGLAKQLGGSAGPLTLSSHIVGTPEYMSPEQAAGNSAVGPPADIYALGVILYELLTGRRPFEGATALETLDLVLHQEPVPPGRLQPRTPRDLETICLKCLRKAPQNRYASAGELADDLRRFTAGEPIRARPVGAAERAWRWAARRPAVAALAAALALSAFVGVAGITAAWLHALAGWTEAATAHGQAVTDRAEAEFRRDEAETNLYFSRVAQAQLEGSISNVASATRLLDLCRPSRSQPTDRRGWEWHFLKGILNCDLLTIPDGHESMVTDLAFTPDGASLVSAGGSPFRPMPPDRVRVWNVWEPGAGHCMCEFPHPQMIYRVALGGLNRIAWSGVDGVVQLAERDTGRVIASHHLPPKHQHAWLAPDARRYAAFTEDGHVGVWDLETGRPELSAVIEGKPHTGLAFSPDGATIAVSGHNSLRLWDVPRRRELAVIAPTYAGRNRPAFSPDGRLVAQGGSSGTVRVWDVGTGRLVQSLSGHTGSVLALAFSPDGERIATAGADHSVRLWSLKTGGQLLHLLGHQGRAGCLAFHPSGRFLASGGEQPAEIKVWDLTRHAEYVTAESTGYRIEAISFTPDGEILTTVRAAGVVHQTSAATGATLATSSIAMTKKWMTPATIAVISIDGQRFAAVSPDDPRAVVISDAESAARLHTLAHDLDVSSVNFSRDGRRLATSAADWAGDGRHAVAVWDAKSGRRVCSVACTPHRQVGIHGVAVLSPDGSVLAHDDFTPDPRIILRDAETGSEIQTITDLPGPVAAVAFSGDGRLLVVTCRDAGIVVYDCTAGVWLHRTPLLGSANDIYYDAAFSPDGRRLAAASRVQVLLWDVSTGQMVLALRGAPPRPSDNGFNARVAWSPDGRRLAATNWNATASIWDAAERQSPEAKRRMLGAAEARTAAR